MSSSDNPQFEPHEPALNADLQPDTPIATDLLASDLFPPLPSSEVAPEVAPPSDENPVWNWWDVLKITVVAIASVVFFQVVLFFVAKRFFFRHLSLLDIAQKPILAILGQFLAYVILAIYMVLLVEGKYRVRFWQAIRWNWPVNSVKFLGIGVFTVALDFLSRFLPMPKNTPFDQFFSRPLDAYLVSIFAVTLGPLMEELFFRGFLYPLLARRMGMFWGIVLTALPFGLIHSMQYGNAWSAVLVIFIVGLVLTTVRAVTKSVASSFLTHVGYNGTLMLLAALATDGFRHMDKAGLFLAHFMASLGK